MRLAGLALLAEVEVGTDTALVSDALNWVDTAAIAGDRLMNLSSLLVLLFGQIVSDLSLEALSGEGLDLLLENLDQALEKGALKFASAIASSAGESLLVDLSAVASEADESVLLVVHLLLFILWTDDLAVDLLLFALHNHLGAFGLSLDASVAADFLHVSHKLRAHFDHVHMGRHFLFDSVDLGAAALTVHVD